MNDSSLGAGLETPPGFFSRKVSIRFIVATRLRPAVNYRGCFLNLIKVKFTGSIVCERIIRL
jgi:hypothetical protein